MSALLALRDAIVVGMSNDPRLQGLRVIAHHGEFDKKSLANYSKQAPFIAVTLLRTEIEDQGGALSADCSFAAVIVAKNEVETTEVVAPQSPQQRRDAVAIRIADAVMRTLRWGGFWADLEGISLPDQIVGRNMFNPDIDGEGIAFWGVGWHQRVDLTEDDDTLGEFTRFHVDWDVSPRDDGADLGEELEAQDDVELPSE